MGGEGGTTVLVFDVSYYYTKTLGMVLVTLTQRMGGIEGMI